MRWLLLVVVFSHFIVEETKPQKNYVNFQKLKQNEKGANKQQNYN